MELEAFYFDQGMIIFERRVSAKLINLFKDHLVFHHSTMSYSISGSVSLEHIEQLQQESIRELIGRLRLITSILNFGDPRAPR